MSGVLAAILSAKRDEVHALRDAVSPEAPRLQPRGGVCEALRHAGSLRLIAEIKRRSPSAGALSTVLSPAERAVAYAHAGASMISVLCDTRFFDGSFAHLSEAREALASAGHETPLLAKEFVLDDVQIARAARSGADAVLLIVRILDQEALQALVASSLARGLEPLVEVVTEEELDRALAAGARVVGVNARDLDTLVMDCARAERVLSKIPPSVVAVHLSGLSSAKDVEAVARGRPDAALVGEALMRQDAPEALLAEMVRAAARG